MRMEKATLCLNNKIWKFLKCFIGTFCLAECLKFGWLTHQPQQCYCISNGCALVPTLAPHSLLSWILEKGFCALFEILSEILGI